MTAAVATATTLVSGAALVAAAVALIRTRDVLVAFAVLLELLTAAGLRRLTGDPLARRLATAATIVALRKVVVASLRTTRRRPAPARTPAGER